MIEHLLFYELSLWKNAHQCTTNPDAIDYGSLSMLYISDMLVSLSELTFHWHDKIQVCEDVEPGTC